MPLRASGRVANWNRQRRALVQKLSQKRLSRPLLHSHWGRCNWRLRILLDREQAANEDETQRGEERRLRQGFVPLKSFS